MDVNKKSYLLGLLFLFASGCATVPITGRSQLSLVPQEQLISLSNQNYQTLLKEAKFSQDKEKVAMVERVGVKVEEASKEFMREKGLFDRIQDYKWEFKLIDDDKTINAFAMPGGKVFVYSGLLPVAKDDAGLATVMGHEIAHVLANHGGERMSQLLIAELGGISLSVAMKEKSQATQQLAMAAYGVGTTVGAILPYSRIHEKEADRIGLILMAKAGYNPEEAIPFWIRMKSSETGSRPPELLSTHPAPDTRINELKKYLPEAMQYYHP